MPHRLRWEMIQKLASSIRGRPYCLVERIHVVNIDRAVELSKGRTGTSAAHEFGGSGMIGRRSRHATAILYTSGTEEFLGIRVPVDAAPRPDDRFHTVVDGDRLDLLAHRSIWAGPICGGSSVITTTSISPWNWSRGSDLRIPSIEHSQMRILG